MHTSDVSRNNAVKLLRFYLKSTRLACNLRWDSDNDAEVEMLVDYIIDAACQKMDEERKEKDDRIAYLEQCAGLVKVG